MYMHPCLFLTDHELDECWRLVELSPALRFHDGVWVLVDERCSSDLQFLDVM